MITELAGFTLKRAIPDHTLIGVLTGAYKVCGGVIRGGNGQIVAHLVNSGNPLSFVSPVGTILKGINTVQLHRIGKDVALLKESVAGLQAATAQIMTLAKGTMLLSGLTLAVSAAGFAFLTKKLAKIEDKIDGLSKEVKAIKVFLEKSERARLGTALKTLGGIDEQLDDHTRIQLLIGARQTLGEINEKYREEFVKTQAIQTAMVIEEYFSVTALGHAMCSAELDMRSQACQDFSETYQTWLTTSQRVARDMILKGNPERFLHSRYSQIARTDEIIDWLDFTEGTDLQLEWIDNLRAKNSKSFSWSVRPSKQDDEETAFLRRLVARNRVFLGYSSQLHYLSENELRPSKFQRLIETLPKDEMVDECYLLVSDEIDKAG